MSRQDDIIAATQWLSAPVIRRRCRFLAAVIYLLILSLGSLPGARAEVGDFVPGYVLHLLAYTVLTLLLFCGHEGSGIRRALAAVVQTSLMGAGDELLQSLLPYRHGTWFDWLLDSAAAVCSATVLHLLYSRLPTRA